MSDKNTLIEIFKAIENLCDENINELENENLQDEISDYFQLTLKEFAERFLQQ